VLNFSFAVGRKALKWDACDENLKSFAHMAAVSLVGCSFCLDDTGKHPVEVSNTQIPSVHEFGHAMGLKHMRPSAGSTDPA
jgi:hypothetical protein